MPSPGKLCSPRPGGPRPAPHVRPRRRAPSCMDAPRRAGHERAQASCSDPRCPARTSAPASGLHASVSPADRERRRRPGGERARGRADGEPELRPGARACALTSCFAFQIMLVSSSLGDRDQSLFVSTDEGATFQKQLAPFSVDTLIFHPQEEDKALAYTKESKVRSRRGTGPRLAFSPSPAWPWSGLRQAGHLPGGSRAGAGEGALGANRRVRCGLDTAGNYWTVPPCLPLPAGHKGPPLPERSTLPPRPARRAFPSARTGPPPSLGRASHPSGPHIGVRPPGAPSARPQGQLRRVAEETPVMGALFWPARGRTAGSQGPRGQSATGRGGPRRGGCPPGRDPHSHCVTPPQT